MCTCRLLATAGSLSRRTAVSIMKACLTQVFARPAGCPVSALMSSLWRMRLLYMTVPHRARGLGPTMCLVTAHLRFWDARLPVCVCHSSRLLIPLGHPCGAQPRRVQPAQDGPPECNSWLVASGDKVAAGGSSSPCLGQTLHCTCINCIWHAKRCRMPTPVWRAPIQRRGILPSTMSGQLAGHAPAGS